MLKRIVIIAILLLGTLSLSLHADNESLEKKLRDKLPELKGTARLNAIIKLQELSCTSPDADYRIRCMNDMIHEAERQGETDLLAKSLAGRIVQYYNLDMNDSVILHVPQDIEKLRAMKQWKQLYEIWMCLVNTYIFTERYNMALREVQQMVEDAKRQGNSYGMGLAYYAMGNVYANMHNPEQSADAYRKSLDILKGVTPLPSNIAELYSYYGDLLNEQKQYHQLETLTGEWKAFLDSFIEANKLSDSDAKVLWSYYYIACLQAALGLNQLDRATEMIDLLAKYKFQEGEYITLSMLYYRAQLLLQKGDYRQALELNTRRIAYFSGEEDKADYMLVASQRAEIQQHLGRYDDAARIYQEIIQIKDSISGSETRNQLNEMNTLYRVDELKMEQERAQFRNTLIIAALIVLALVVFTVFRIRAARRLKKAHDQLEKTHSDLLVAYDQLEETTTAKERIESDLRIARNIQMGMVPSTFPERPDLDLYASMTPAKEVGGDLYGYLLVPGNAAEGRADQLYFCLGDVSGKGVPASLFMAQATRLFRTLAAQQMMPAEIATRINEALSGEDNETGMFVTMFIGLVDLSTGHLWFSNAGHNPPVLLADGKASFIDMIPNAPIGLWPGLEYEGEEIDCITDKPFFVYTDGLNEAENRQQEQFTDERLLEMLEQHPFQSSRQTVEMLRDAVEAHRDGAEPNDDLTMLCVKVMKQDNN